MWRAVRTVNKCFSFSKLMRSSPAAVPMERWQVCSRLSAFLFQWWQSAKLPLNFISRLFVFLSIGQVVCRKDDQVKSKKENIQKNVSVYRSSVYILIFLVCLKFKAHMGETGSPSDTGSLSASHNLWPFAVSITTIINKQIIIYHIPDESMRTLFSPHEFNVFSFPLAENFLRNKITDQL